MIYTVTLNPALDKTVQIPSFRLGEVNRISAMRTDPGGKGINVSKVLRELGEPSVAAAILGGAAGRKIESALRALGIEGMYLFTGHETRTNLKIVDPTLHTNTDVNEPGAPADEAVLSKLLTQLTDRLRPGDLVVLSGKAPAGAPDTLYRDWILACRAAGAAVYLDAEGELLRQGVTAGPALIKPNQAELSGVMGRPLTTEDETIRAAQELLARAARFCAGRTACCAAKARAYRSAARSARATASSRRWPTHSSGSSRARIRPASLWRRARPTSCAPAHRRPGLVTSNSSCRRCASPDCELFTISLPIFETLFKIFRYTLNIRSETNRSVLFCIFRRCARLMPRKYLRISRQPCA